MNVRTGYTSLGIFASIVLQRSRRTHNTAYVGQVCGFVTLTAFQGKKLSQLN